MTAIALQDPPATYDIDDIMRRVGKAKSLLILDHPFFGMGCSKRPIVYTDTIPTACMSATGQMYMNPAFVDPLTVPELMFLLAHEALHYMLCHSLRLGTRDAKAWNVACDKVINDTLVDAKVGDPIDGGVYMDGARDFSAEELYDDADADGPGAGGIGNDVGPPCDDGGQPLDESQIHQLEAQAKIEAIQATKAAKAVGKLPGSIERLVDQLVNVSTPWHEILERFMEGKVRDNLSFNRPSKRFTTAILPSHDTKPSMGVAALVIDSSGSVTSDEFDMYNAHINRVLHTCNPEVLHVIYCDTQVTGHDEFTVEDLPVSIKTRAGGGTEFKPAFDYIDDHGIDPEVVVYFTDGYADSDFTTKHETVWLTTGSTNFKFGTVIKFEE
jgi:predicted metal-dependent peptidase